MIKTIEKDEKLHTDNKSTMNIESVTDDLNFIISQQHLPSKEIMQIITSLKDKSADRHEPFMWVIMSMYYLGRIMGIRDERKRRHHGE